MLQYPQNPCFSNPPPPRAGGREGGRKRGNFCEAVFSNGRSSHLAGAAGEDPGGRGGPPGHRREAEGHPGAGGQRRVLSDPPQGKGVVRVETVTGPSAARPCCWGACPSPWAGASDGTKNCPWRSAGAMPPAPSRSTPWRGMGRRTCPCPCGWDPGPFCPKPKQRRWSACRGLVCVLRSGAALPEDAVLAPALDALARENEVPAAAALLWNFRAGSLSGRPLAGGRSESHPPPLRVAAAGAAAAWSAGTGPMDTTG